MKSVEDIWHWTKNTVAYGIRSDRWYNDAPPHGLAGFFNDKTSRIIGYANLRQLRVRNETCSINNKMKSHQIGHCTESFSDKLQETSSFNYGWSSVAPFNSSF
jgi:hypothetical protein